MPIRQLPPSLVNKIAAGEVIERPASVVKELMENAVDAGAGRIDVSVGQGGREVIRVVDDGHGIPPEELPLAVASHATSKLADAEDLFRVATLGFRGEALASIAAVSRLSIRSRTAQSDAGAELEVVGGRPEEVSPCGCPVGTQIEVRNLFFNTPVRGKFLRTVQTEFGHISEAFTRIALANPGVHFTLRHNDRPVHDLPAEDNSRERIARFFGRELADALIPIESSDGDIRLHGYVAHPSHSRGNNRMQYVFLNDRHIRDRALQHALGEAYRGLLTVGRYPIAFLSIQMPPDLVDVNVHPTKLEVRFQDSGRIYSQLLSTLRAKFLTTDLDTRIGPTDDEGRDESTDAVERGRHGVDQQAEQMRQQVVDWAKGQVAGWGDRQAAGQGGVGGAGTGHLGAGQGGEFCMPGASTNDPSGVDHGPLRLNRIDRPPLPASAAGTSNEDYSAMAHAAGEAGVAATPGPRHALALQVHNRYLITETDEGVTVIDQHALHERILYEQLRARIDAGPIETQQLLVPEPVDLPSDEAAAALENCELLGKLGLQVEPFGGDTVLITGYPAMLANLRPAEVLHEVLQVILAGVKQPEPRDLLDELLHTVACKAAVKAGDRLEPEEIYALLEQRHLVQDAHHCPHGRPTALVFTREELDKRFKRT